MRIPPASIARRAPPGAARRSQSPSRMIQPDPTMLPKLRAKKQAGRMTRRGTLASLDKRAPSELILQRHTDRAWRVDSNAPRGGQVGGDRDLQRRFTDLIEHVDKKQRSFPGCRGLQADAQVQQAKSIV